MSRKQTVSNINSNHQLVIGLGLLYAFVQLITATRIYALSIVDVLELSVTELIVDRVIGWIVGFAVIVLVVGFTRNIIQRGWPTSWVLSAHLVLLFPITFIWYYVFNKCALLACQLHGNCAQDESSLFPSYLLNMDRLIIMYILTVIVTYTYYYMRRDHDNQLRQSQMETKVLQARMKMLRSQLHPHFLFNTLNSVNSLMDIDVQKAQTMVVDLSDLLRKVLAWKDNQKVNLSEELALLKRYTDIEKIRFSDDLEVSWDIADDIGHLKVPGLLLQPLVENAIHHGFSPNHLHLDIHIKAFVENERLVLQVADNGQGFSKEDEQNIFKLGTGVQNTRERLVTLYQDDFNFTVKNKAQGVLSQISLPTN